MSDYPLGLQTHPRTCVAWKSLSMACLQNWNDERLGLWTGK
jgi:hypothetical protein